MRKTLIAILMALVVIPVSSAFADTTAGVTVKATPTYVGITVALTLNDFGVVTASSTPATGETHFTITNSSSVAIDTTIKCNGWTGASGHNWSYGASGTDQGQLKASSGSGGYTITVPVDPTTIALHSNVSVGNNPQWGLQLEAPSSFSYGDTQTTTVTITAAQHT
jgi:hypothetical protein